MKKMPLVHPVMPNRFSPVAGQSAANGELLIDYSILDLPSQWVLANKKVKGKA